MAIISDNRSRWLIWWGKHKRFLVRQSKNRFPKYRHNWIQLSRREAIRTNIKKKYKDTRKQALTLRLKHWKRWDYMVFYFDIFYTKSTTSWVFKMFSQQYQRLDYLIDKILYRIFHECSEARRAFYMTYLMDKLDTYWVTCKDRHGLYSYKTRKKQKAEAMERYLEEQGVVPDMVDSEDLDDIMN